jgi:hypothetical protein
MHHLIGGAMTMAHSNMKVFLKAWRTQLDALQRCSNISAQAVLAWRERALAPWRAFLPAQYALNPSLQFADDDPHIKNLGVCWRDMYHAVCMHEAIGEIQPQLARLVEDRIEDFNRSIAAARAGESTKTAPSACRGMKVG